MRVLVTGGTGFIGSNLVKILVELGHSVTATGCQTENKLPGKVKLLNCHLTGIDWKEVKSLDIVFHQAANNDTLDNDSREMSRANVEAPKELFRKAYEGGCRQFVYASSTAVYGDACVPYREDDMTYIRPLNTYGISKALFDSFAKNFSDEVRANIIGLRYCNVYGPGESHKGKRASMVYQIYQKMKNGESPKLFSDGEQKRDWCYIEDVVKINLLASQYSGSGIFNVGFGKAVSFNDIVEAWNEVMETEISPEYIPNPYEQSYQNHTECSVIKAVSKLKWNPKFDIKAGIREYYKWLKNQ